MNTITVTNGTDLIKAEKANPDKIIIQGTLAKQMIKKQNIKNGTKIALAAASAVGATVATVLTAGTAAPITLPTAMSAASTVAIATTATTITLSTAEVFGVLATVLGISAIAIKEITKKYKKITFRRKECEVILEH